MDQRPPTSRPPKEPLIKQPAPGLRGKVERTSAPLLLWLTSRPKFVIPLLSAVLLIAGLAAPVAVGVPLLLADRVIGVLFAALCVRLLIPPARTLAERARAKRKPK